MEKIRERGWPTVLLTPITISSDKIIVADTRGLHPKQQIEISNAGLEPLSLEVKRVIDQFTIQVGPSSKFGEDPANKRRGGIHEISKVSMAYNGGTLTAREQARTSISSEAIFSSVYAEEPTVALRTIGVNYWGTPLDQPEAQVEQQEPIARFIYGPSFEVLFIREFAPDAQVGDPCRVTQFKYGPSLEAQVIRTYASTVTSSDISALPAEVFP